MRTYWKRLKAHPGVPVATAMSVMFPLAGLANENGRQGGLIAGAVAALAVWAIVLWTARTQPLPREED